MNTQPQVSVVIGAYNTEKYLEATVQSVLQQTYRDFELIIVDDGSIDRTREVALALADKDSRVRCIGLDKNSGLPAVPRNRGITEARGELVAFLDHDDIWTKWKLEDQVAVMLSHPELVLTYSMLKLFGQVHFFSREYGVLPLPTSAPLSKSDLMAGKTIPCSSVIARCALLRAVGGFDENPQLKATEDYDLWLRISGQGPIGFIPRIHGYYRVHPAGTSQNLAIQNRRRRYLVEEGKLLPSALLRDRSYVEIAGRSLVHFITIVWMSLMDRLMRTLRMKVPLYSSKKDERNSFR